MDWFIDGLNVTGHRCVSCLAESLDLRWLFKHSFEANRIGVNTEKVCDILNISS